MHTDTTWITFDCFGTLVDWNTGFVQILLPFAGDKTAQLIATYHEYERPMEMKKPFQRYKDVVIVALLTAAAECNVPLTMLQAREIITRWDEMRLFPDTEPMLAMLRAQGFKLGVLTNCDNDLFELTHRRFRHSFDAVITSENVGSYKPSPAHFQSFWRKTRADRRRWIHVSNSWHHDIFSAKGFGIQSVWLDRERIGDELRSSSASARVFIGDEVPEQVLRLLEAQNCSDANRLSKQLPITASYKCPAKPV